MPARAIEGEGWGRRGSAVGSGTAPQMPMPPPILVHCCLRNHRGWRRGSGGRLPRRRHALLLCPLPAQLPRFAHDLPPAHSSCVAHSHPRASSAGYLVHHLHCPVVICRGREEDAQQQVCTGFAVCCAGHRQAAFRQLWTCTACAASRHAWSPPPLPPPPPPPTHTHTHHTHTPPSLGRPHLPPPLQTKRKIMVSLDDSEASRKALEVRRGLYHAHQAVSAQPQPCWPRLPGHLCSCHLSAARVRACSGSPALR